MPVGAGTQRIADGDERRSLRGRIAFVLFPIAGEVLGSVEFEVAGAKSGGITGAFSSADSDMQAIVTARLGCATKADTKVKFDMLIEFLDQDGQVIDRKGAKDSLKNNDKVFNIKHTTLRWAVDYIDSARITVAVRE